MRSQQGRLLVAAMLVNSLGQIQCKEFTRSLASGLTRKGDGRGKLCAPIPNSCVPLYYHLRLESVAPPALQLQPLHAVEPAARLC